MGIGITYQGKLLSPELVPELVTDLRAWARGAGWPSKDMDTLLAEGIVTCAGLTGISLYPHPQCEPIRFHFDADGIFVNHFYQGLLTPGSRLSKMMLDALAESAKRSQVLAAGAKADTPKGTAKNGDEQAQPNDVATSSFLEQGRRCNWTKTQFAGPAAHIAVCEVLRHVKARYAPDLEIHDDSGYFEHGDRAKLLGALGYFEDPMEATSSPPPASFSKDTPH